VEEHCKVLLASLWVVFGSSEYGGGEEEEELEATDFFSLGFLNLNHISGFVMWWWMGRSKLELVPGFIHFAVEPPS